MKSFKVPFFSPLGNTSRPHNSSHSAGNPPSRTPKRPRKRRCNFPMEKLMEQFLEQSAQAEESFYRAEEQRLQAEDRRRETEHARELHMLQVLAQMFSSISSARPGAAGKAAAKPPNRAPVAAGVSPSHACGRTSPQKDCLSADSLGISSGVVEVERVKRTLNLCVGCSTILILI